MTALDNDALIAAFQLNSPPSIVSYRAKVRHFIATHGGLFMVPAVVLSEYLFKFDEATKLQEFNEILNRHVFIPPYDKLAAEISADLGRRYSNGRTLSSVARQAGTDRFCLKSDLLVVASALRHTALHIVTNDPLTHEIAKFAGLDSYLLKDLPEPLPLPPPPPPSRPKANPGGEEKNLFNFGETEG